MGATVDVDQARQQLQRRLRQGAETQGRPVQLQPGQVLFEVNDISDGAYVLEEGDLRITIRNPSGCSAGDDGALVIGIGRGEAMALIDSDTEARQALVLILSERARNMVRFIHDFSHLTALVAKGDYDGVQTLINSSGSSDPSVKAAREAFRTMLDRVKQREAELQTTIATLSLEIDHQRAAQEVESILSASSFQNLQQNSADLRRRLRGE
jgi:CRP-like cAMP-binding protein